MTSSNSSRKCVDLSLSKQKATPLLPWKTRFRIIASKASLRNRNPHVYSTTEEPIRRELESLGLKEGQAFVHEHRVDAYCGIRGQPVYYWLDFFIPDLNLALEADGEIWHKFFDTVKRDRRRDKLIAKKHGIKVVRLNSFDVRRIRIRQNVTRILLKRCVEIILEDGEGTRNLEPFLRVLI